VGGIVKKLEHCLVMIRAALSVRMLDRSILFCAREWCVYPEN